MGDLKAVLGDLIPMVEPADHEDWLDQIAEWKADTEARDILAWPEDGLLYSSHVIRDIWTHTNGDALITTDVGQHQMWAAQYYKLEQPYRFLTSGGAGTMGYGMPAAIGAWFGHKDREVWAIVGDGGFQMTQAELATAKNENANVKIVILNNSYLGMVRQWQEFFYQKRYAMSYMESLPDFVKLAESYGHVGMQITKPGDVEGALVEMLKLKDRLVFMDFKTDSTENVYPMIPAGGGQNEMILI
jgi:acetolactate synthase-1/2/3 large subunit